MTGAPAAAPRMLAEALEGPEVVERLLRENRSEVEDLARFLRHHHPPFALTVNAGAGAALYGKFLLETLLGVVTAAAAASVVIDYRGGIDAGRALALALLPGGGPDLSEVVSAARRGGALTVALADREEAPAARAAGVVLPLHAGPSSAAVPTKALLALFASLAQVAASWSEDRALREAVEALPDVLDRARESDWSRGVEPLELPEGVLVLAAGYAEGVGGEIAAVMARACDLRAAAASPFALPPAGEPQPVLVAALKDRPLERVVAAAARLRERGAPVLVASPDPDVVAPAAARLPLPPPRHPVIDPVGLAQAAFPFAAHLARARGRDPDRPGP